MDGTLKRDPNGHVPLSPVTFLRRAADVYRDKPAVVTRAGRTLTYRQFKQEVEVVVAALRRSGWARPDVQVAVLSRNGPELLGMHYAVPAAGATLVALNTRLAPEEYQHILEHCEAEVLFVDPGLMGGLAAILPQLPCEVVVLPDPDTGQLDSGPGLGYAEWRDEEEAPGGQLAGPRSEDAPIAINYTSGTTGSPKGAVYTHRGAYLNALSVAIELRLTAESVYLWTLPMFHCNGWCCTWAVTAVGATHVTMADMDPRAAIDLIAEHEVSHLCGAPVVLQMLSEAGRARSVTFPHKVSIATGGAPPAPATLAAMAEMGIDVVHLYGLTESYGPSLVCEVQSGWEELSTEKLAELMSRQGVPTVGVDQVRVVDDQGVDVPEDGKTLGELLIRSNTVVAGYFKDPAATSAAIDEGWLRTGDLAVVDPDGYVAIRDRKKDIIISGGENISSIEVENALMAHPSVTEVAVVAMPSEKWGEVPMAFVGIADGHNVTESELIEHVRSRLARFKAPKRVVFGELPRTSTGKVMKHQLRKLSAGKSDDV